MYCKPNFSLVGFIRKVRRLKLILLAVFMSVTLILLTILSVEERPFIPVTVENISCHYIESSNELLSVDEMSPDAESIFFHETSCRGGLDSRQACSVESAARAHPGREVYVMFSSPVAGAALDSEPLATLLALPNVRLRRVLIRDYARGTPVDRLVRGGALGRSRWKISHTSDVLRYLTLYKWSGLYLDLDTVVVRPMDDLPKNFATRENDDYVAASPLAFHSDELGRMVSNLTMWDLAKKFSGTIWGQNGPMLITRILKEVCGTDDVTLMSPAICKGFEVYGPEQFFPLSPNNPGYFLRPGDLKIDPHAYLYHIWNAQTHNMKVDPDSPYAKLAIEYCPSVYEAYRNNFGE